ncbi:hypothetical protein [Natronorubrum tibetense]|uniref:Uncharacterized protein n=1 Tax=Natronorubrum tibetense GA33 TaxID=1114856 RepID=L9VRR8_9EURY|nr:hypothetical protein [Natronorubrum tibetense]ELY39859.1 hypothetical protein C496_14316 [Natronorubrum tibetense GA33]
MEACISQFAGGIATFAFFSSFEHQLPEEAFNQVIEEFATNLENFRWWEDDVDESIFKYLYDIDAVTGPVYLPREDSYLWDGVDKSELPEALFIEEEEEKEEPVDDQGISIEMTNPEDSQYLFGSLVSRYAIDRYRFAKHDNNRLVLEHDGVPDLPPYGIIRSLQAQGYSLTNVPTFHPKDSLPELLKTIDELVQWVRKRYEPEHYKSLAAYSHYFYPLQEVVCLSALREADETEYNNIRNQFFEKYNISPESFPARQLDLQTVQTITREFIPLFGKEQFSAAERLFEEIQYEKRMHQLEKIAAESDDLNRPDEQLQKTQTDTHPHLWNK